MARVVDGNGLRALRRDHRVLVVQVLLQPVAVEVPGAREIRHLGVHAGQRVVRAHHVDVNLRRRRRRPAEGNDVRGLCFSIDGQGVTEQLTVECANTEA